MGRMERPICKIEGCVNLAEAYGRRSPGLYRSLCNTHRRTTHGRLTGWQRVNLRIKLEKEKRKGDGCDRCGAKGPKGFLELHHKANGHKDNSFENLTILCPNCHRIADLSVAPK